MKGKFVTKSLVVAFVALVVISIIAVNGLPFGIRGKSEGFTAVGKAHLKNAGSVEGFKVKKNEGFKGPNPPNLVYPPGKGPEKFANTSIKRSSSSMPLPPMPMPSSSSMPVAPMPRSSSLPMTGSSLGSSGKGENGENNNSEHFATQQGAKYMKEKFTTGGNYADSAAGTKGSYEPMGAYDGVTLPTGNNVSNWRYTAPNEPLLGADFTPGNDSLFIFKNNQCKPECCGASFSCSGGCVCTTEKQRDYINGRGGNRTSPAED